MRLNDIKLILTHRKRFSQNHWCYHSDIILVARNPLSRCEKTTATVRVFTSLHFFAHYTIVQQYS